MRQPKAATRNSARLKPFGEKKKMPKDSLLDMFKEYELSNTSTFQLKGIFGGSGTATGTDTCNTTPTYPGGPSEAREDGDCESDSEQ